MKQRLLEGLMGVWAARAGKAGACLASAAVAGAFLMHVFGAHQVASAARSANVYLLAGAVGVGA